MNKIITIVTPSFNQGRFIEETMQSVLAQEGDFFIDYIISDGGSTDNTIEIIKKYDKLLKEKNYPLRCDGVKLRWWSESDNGQSHAINKGFKIAEGDILAWINSDDYYEPGAFEIINRKMVEKLDIDLFYGDGYILNDELKTKEISAKEDGNLKSLLEGKYYVFQPSTFFTRRIIKKIGLLDENLHYAMDYDLWIRIFKEGKAYHIKKPLSTFRVWENSKTGSQQKKFLSDRKIVLKKHGGNIIDPEIIYKIRNKMPFFNYFSKKNFKFYKLLKKLFYFLSNKLHYKASSK